MSYVVSNLKYEGKPFVLTEDEVKHMSDAEFDDLMLSDQIGIFHNYPDQYARLTGRDVPRAESGSSDASANVDEYERRINDIITRAFRNDNR